MLLDAQLPKSLWAHAYKHSVYVHNRTGQDALEGRTPYEARFGVPLDLHHLRPWGARVWVCQEKFSKLDPKARSGRFVGFSDNHRDAINVYWPDKKNITVVRSYIWEDGSMNMEVDVPVVPSEGASEEVEVEAHVGDLQDAQHDGNIQEIEPAGEREVEGGHGIEPAGEQEPEVEGERGGDRIRGEGACDGEARDGPDENDGEVLEQAPKAAPMGRGHRIKKPSAYARSLQRGEGTIDGRDSQTRRYPNGMAPAEIMGVLVALELLRPHKEEGLLSGEWVKSTIAQNWDTATHVLMAQAAGDPLSSNLRSL